MSKASVLIISVTLVTLLATNVITGCSNKPSAQPATPQTPKSTPAATTPPAPPPVVTFEQKRSDVLMYVSAFNTIENSFGDSTSQIAFPQSVNTAADLMAWNAAVAKYLTAIDGAISRLTELKPSSLETATNAHLQRARSLYASQRLILKGLQDAVSVGNAEGIAQKMNELATSDKDASSLNRTTEQLMLQYNISDSEVTYRFRGK